MNIENQDRQIAQELEELVHQKVVRQLHDGLSQTVSALAMRTNFARRMIDEDTAAAKDELVKVEQLARDTTREIRNLIFILRPESSTSRDLNELLELLVEKMVELFDLKIDLDLDETLAKLLPASDQKVIYHLVEEAIGSARKRNRSTHLTVSLTQYEKKIVQLTIEGIHDSNEMMEFPFKASEMENLQEFSELINGSLNVLGEGSKIQVLFPLSRKSEGGQQPES